MFDWTLRFQLLYLNQTPLLCINKMVMVGCDFEGKCRFLVIVIADALRIGYHLISLLLYNV